VRTCMASATWRGRGGTRHTCVYVHDPQTHTHTTCATAAVPWPAGYNGWQGDARKVGMRTLAHDHPARAEHWLNDKGGDWWIAEPVYVHPEAKVNPKPQAPHPKL